VPTLGCSFELELGVRWGLLLLVVHTGRAVHSEGWGRAVGKVAVAPVRGVMATQPSHCPSCGARVESMRLNFAESMLCCTGADCIWPLDTEDDVDQFVVTDVSQQVAGALGAAAVVPGSKPRKRRKGGARHSETTKKQQPAARATAAAAPTDGRASPAASPIRSPEFATAQDWAGFSGDERLLKPSDAGSMQPMLKPSAHTAADSTAAVMLSPRVAGPATTAAPGVEPLSIDAIGSGNLQAHLDELDAFLAGDTL
jgi:hypothetical protein